ncbi:methyltransferase domain protein [Ceratobasidium sp. AG-Ba]|nr:methyltransferase domain protein [Ceratobasidium sp. AG-Ba]QRW10949.1 methyltransferase domain protein [Ceratobasidium sp. AG-Ba]
MPAIPFYDPETNGFVYYVEPEVHTFYSDSVSDISGETETSESGRTIATDDLPAYFTEHHGRPQPSGNVVRWFPTDNTRRFIVRHFVESYIHGGNCAPIVKEILLPKLGRTYHVLELGTRDGTWVQEMAAEFSDVRFRSLDVAPLMAHVPRSNIAFEVYEFPEGLLLDDSSQDIVFLNALFELVKDYPALIREVHRVLRPGGLIHIRDFDVTIYDSKFPTIPAIRTNPNGCKVSEYLKKGLAQMGVDVQTFEKLPSWLASEEMFENIQDRTRMFPLYPHESDICGHKVDPRIAPYMDHFAVSSFREVTHILGEIGMSKEEARSLVEGAIDEFRAPGNCILFKLPCIYAFKKGV